MRDEEKLPGRIACLMQTLNSFRNVVTFEEYRLTEREKQIVHLVLVYLEIDALDGAAACLRKLGVESKWRAQRPTILNFSKVGEGENRYLLVLFRLGLPPDSLVN